MTNKVFIIAEMSANHNHNFDLAVKTIEAMAEAGADAVKFQTYTPDSLTMNINNSYFGPRESGLWKGMTLYEIYTEGAMPYEWQPKLKKIANDLGLVCFSSPFDNEGIDFMEQMDMPIYKIASLEITDVNLIEYAASKLKPMIISTGVATIEDIELAIATCRKVGNNDITLLKCTTDYPAPIELANLLSIPDMKQRFGVKVGVSDHSMTNIIPITSVALGASVVEKHFIIDRALGGLDAAFSLNKEEFASMVNSIRETEQALGVVSYDLVGRGVTGRRSLFASGDINKGEMFTVNNVKSVRPADGLHPKYYSEILGKRAMSDICKGNPLKTGDICE
jgi:pseudaminic acid synthase